MADAVVFGPLLKDSGCNSVAPVPGGGLLCATYEGPVVSLWDPRQPRRPAAITASGFPVASGAPVDLAEIAASADAAVAIGDTAAVRIDWRQARRPVAAYVHPVDLCSIDRRWDSRGGSAGAAPGAAVWVGDEDGAALLLDATTLRVLEGAPASAAAELAKGDAAAPASPALGPIGGHSNVVYGVAALPSDLKTTGGGAVLTVAADGSARVTDVAARRALGDVDLGAWGAAAAAGAGAAQLVNPPIPIACDFAGRVAAVARGDGTFALLHLRGAAFSGATAAAGDEDGALAHILDAPGQAAGNGLAAVEWCSAGAEGADTLLTAATSGEVFVWGVAAELRRAQAEEDTQLKNEGAAPCAASGENDSDDDDEGGLPCHFAFELRTDVPAPAAGLQAAVVNTACYAPAGAGIAVGDAAGRIVLTQIR